MKFHLIANAHLDPVWLWDWREGLNEGLVTCRTILDMMDEIPDFTFIRGEAAIYRHIEETDPPTFARIRRQIESGRWDVVGGSWIQPDTNLSSTETLCRHFQVGRAYFESRFGSAPHVAWAADSFGHSAGLPEILSASGMDGFAFTRPADGQLKLEKPAFWWQARSGHRVLAYRPPAGWYGSERDEMSRRLDSALEAASNSDLENVGVFYGVGNHGGGPTRRFLQEIETWKAAHSDVEVIHSGLHRLFAALRGEATEKGEDFFPTQSGELNFCLRGCYSSAAKIKIPYRRLEATASRAETLSNLVGTATAKIEYSKGADAIWETVLFNSFHDILPGSSIERAFDDQRNEIGGALFGAQKIELNALNALAARVDTQVAPVEGDFPSSTPFLVWNPQPRAFAGLVEIEANLDYRPLFAYADRADEVPLEVRNADGKTLPFQRVATEHDAFADTPWRARVLVPAVLPPLGWSVFSLGYVEGAVAPIFEGAPVRAEKEAIENEWYRVEANSESGELSVQHRGKELFKSGLQFLTVRDEWGSWGGMSEEPESLDLSDVLQRWKLTQCHVLESGPMRGRLWTRWSGGDSHLDLTLSLSSGREALDAEVRLLWNERAARLKMVMQADVREAVFSVPGATATRGEVGQVPGGHWVKTDAFGFASDALYDFDLQDGALRTTLVRATRYASSRKIAATDEMWRPALDCGELKFRFLLAPGEEQSLATHSRVLENAPLVQMVAPSPGDWSRAGSLASLSPDNLELLALCLQDRELFLRVRETNGQKTTVRFILGGEEKQLGEIGAYEIKTWCLPEDNQRRKADAD